MSWTEELFALVTKLRLNCRVAWHEHGESDKEWGWTITVFVEQATGKQIGVIDEWRDSGSAGRSVQYDAARGFRLIQKLPRGEQP